VTRKIIIDTDPGIDDAMAIHYAFAHPDLEVLGLTTIFGNVHTETATRNALALAEQAGAACPVARGAAKPVSGDPISPADFVHGADGFGDLPPSAPTTRPDPRDAAEFLRETVGPAGEVTIVALGPLTNLALALDRDPAIARNVRDVVIMGGAVDVGGNISPHAEANIFNDPHAADRVFAAPWEMTLVGLDVTTRVHCAPSDFAGLASAAPVIGGFLNRAVQFYFDFHRRQHDLDACYMHDPTSIIAITNPECFETEKTPILTVTDGERAGMTERSYDPSRRSVKVCIGVDEYRVRRAFLETIGAADDRRAERAGG
jgi:inosine-uridine nucleoside N-ribohydrolase